MGWGPFRRNNQLSIGRQYAWRIAPEVAVKIIFKLPCLACQTKHHLSAKFSAKGVVKRKKQTIHCSVSIKYLEWEKLCFQHCNCLYFLTCNKRHWRDVLGNENLTCPWILDIQRAEPLIEVDFFCSCFCLCLFFPFVLFYSLPPCGFSPNTRHFVCLLCFGRVLYFIYQMFDSLSYSSRNNTLHCFVHHLNQCFYMILYLYVNWITAKTHDVYSEYARKESNR